MKRRVHLAFVEQLENGWLRATCEVSGEEATTALHFGPNFLGLGLDVKADPFERVADYLRTHHNCNAKHVLA